ncbi:hypothetical protein QE152_g9347 [Popillia japonica]|uniref:Uncharacterized protein n=1 Tax=Popillia japonica TaxID=7064 RepID=A0AAW1LZ31_POPJA
MSQGESAPTEDLIENIISPSTYLICFHFKSKTQIKERFSKARMCCIGPTRNGSKVIAERLQSRSNNKYSNYEAYVGQESDALPPMMATYCQKIIHDALFEAKYGQLTAQSRIVTGFQTNPTNPQHFNVLSKIPPTNPQHFNVLSKIPDYNQSSTWQPPSTAAYYTNFIP